MPKRGKKYLETVKNIDRQNRYDFSEAIQKAIGASYAKFDETVDVAVRLGVDPRHADQMVRGTVVLPNGLGKEVKVLVFAKGEKEAEAREAGADFVGNDEMVEKIQGGWLDFDKAVATPGHDGGRGQAGTGTRSQRPYAQRQDRNVTFEVAKAVEELKAGKIDFRVEKTGIVHAPMGKVSFGAEKVIENITAFFEAIIRLKPAASKGAYVRSVAVSTTMGPGVKVDTAFVKELGK